MIEFYFFIFLRIYVLNANNKSITKFLKVKKKYYQKGNYKIKVGFSYGIIYLPLISISGPVHFLLDSLYLLYDHLLLSSSGVSLWWYLGIVPTGICRFQSNILEQSSCGIPFNLLSSSRATSFTNLMEFCGEIGERKSL